MTAQCPPQRPQLELLMEGHTHGNRSPVTCALKCDNACAFPAPNNTEGEDFQQVATAALTRRGLLGAAGAGALVIAGGQAAPAAASEVQGRVKSWGYVERMSFRPIAPVERTVDKMTVPKGYGSEVLIRWGDPVVAGAPVFDVDSQTGDSQALQFGYNNDYTDIIELNTRGTRALLVCNHEYVNPGVMFPPGMDPLETIRVALQAHGLSVVELRRRRRGMPWRLVPVERARRNRRITGTTRFRLDGPAAGSDLLKTDADPSGRRVYGTFNNCAGGTTPWGTVLSGEENFNGYFRVDVAEKEARYGMKDAPTRYGFEEIDDRFDARGEGKKNEPNRFGWVVEVDPLDPRSTPVKHTAMGRFKHEGANVIVAEDGHVVAYMGDDERFDYVYKFVSKRKYREGSSWADRRHNKRLLSAGDLYVAKFTGDSPAGEIVGDGTLPADGEFDGSGQWVPLTKDGESMVEGMSLEEVLVYTRLAADQVGATKMDRPEDVEPSLKSGKIYIACTNNKNRGVGSYDGVDEANPRTANKEGHVVEITENNGQTSETFSWKLLLVCGDPESAGTYFGGFPKSKVSPISCPDNVAFDSQGNLWISTDGQPGTLGLSDGLFKVPVTGAQRGRVQQFLAVPADAETCGPVIRDQEKMAFVAVQHPGENGSWSAPTSKFPDFGSTAHGDFAGGPRPSIVQVYKARRGWSHRPRRGWGRR